MFNRLKHTDDFLIQKLISGIPESVWASKITTFFDPDMGGGQIVKKIVEKLRSHGHSDSNIKTRVSGLCQNRLAHNYIHNSSGNDIIGNFVIADFLEESYRLAIKPTVIISSPKFEGAVPNNKGKRWSAFLQKCADVVIRDGYCGLIVPATWASPSKETGVRVKILTALTTDLNLESVSYSGHTAIVFSKKAYQHKTIIGDDVFDLSGMTFIPKSFNAAEIGMVRKICSKSYRHLSFKHLSTHSTDGIKLSQNSGKYAYFNAAFNHPTLYGNKVKDNAYYGTPKICMSYIGGYKFGIDKTGKKYACMHNTHMHRLVGNENLELLQKNLNSKVAKMLFRNVWHSYNEPKIASLIPIMDEDIPLETFFGFSKKEIDYLNSLVI